MTRVQKPRPGDFSGVWSHLAPGVQAQLTLMIQALARPCGVPRRLEQFEVIKLRAVAARVPHLTPEQRQDLGALLASLEHHS